MKSGIYLIKNLITNKLYIGKACYIKKRLNTHKWALRHKKHVNKFGDYVKLRTFAIRNNGKAQELIKKKDTKREQKNILRKYLEV